FRSEDSLNAFLTLGRPASRKAREILQHLLSVDTPTLRNDPKLRARVFHAQKDVVMQLPARIGVITDARRQLHHDILLRVKNPSTKLRVIAQRWRIDREKMLEDFARFARRRATQREKRIERVLRSE